MLPKAMRNDIHSSFACRCCDSTDDMIYIVVSITDQSEFYLCLLLADFPYNQRTVTEVLRQ